MRAPCLAFALAASAIVAPALSQAQPQTLKPGLWELSIKTQSASGQVEQAQAQMRQQMASMSPEQRKMIEEMMARQGVSLGASGNTMKVCMSKEMVERSEMPLNGDCKTTGQSRSGNTLKMAFACTNPPSTGEGEYTLMGPEAYKSRATVKTAVNGKPETLTVDSTGKWMGADCGALRPLAPPTKK